MGIFSSFQRVTPSTSWARSGKEKDPPLAANDVLIVPESFF
jgi:hypothetical protein